MAISFNSSRERNTSTRTGERSARNDVLLAGALIAALAGVVYAGNEAVNKVEGAGRQAMDYLAHHGDRAELPPSR